MNKSDLKNLNEAYNVILERSEQKILMPTMAADKTFVSDLNELMEKTSKDPVFLKYVFDKILEKYHHLEIGDLMSSLAEFAEENPQFKKSLEEAKRLFKNSHSYFEEWSQLAYPVDRIIKAFERVKNFTTPPQ